MCPNNDDDDKDVSEVSVCEVFIRRSTGKALIFRAFAERSVVRSPWKMGRGMFCQAGCFS